MSLNNKTNNDELSSESKTDNKSCELSGEQLQELNRMVIKERDFYDSIGLEMISEMAIA